MSRYAAYVALADPPGAYRDLELTIEAESPRDAARQAFELADLRAQGEWPEILVVPDDQVHVFLLDEHGRTVTVDEDLRRLAAPRPRLVVVNADAD